MAQIGQSPSRQPRDLAGWGTLIRSDLGRALEGLVAAGRHLNEAKESHPRDFLRWLDAGSLGIKRSYAYMLMSIAEHPSLSKDSSMLEVLPTDATSLYELTRLTTSQLSAAIAAGEVRRDTPRHEVKAIVARRRIDGHLGDGRTARPLAADGMASYRTVVIDPPWPWDNVATRGAADHHYPSMTLDELAELELPLAEDAHVYLWTTNTHLPAALWLLEEWKLDYKTCLTWVKPQLGMGNYFRNTTEHVLFATRGSLATLRKDQPTSFEAARGRHSEKPETAFYQSIVERCSPGPYLEIFARRRRDGWDVWGNEVTTQQA